MNRLLIAAIIVFSLGLLGLGYRLTGLQKGVQNGQSDVKGSQNQKAPDFEAAKLGGGTISLADYKGEKPVVLDFWASWCPNCRRNMPILNRLYDKYKDRVGVIGINIQEDEATVSDFISSTGINYPIALDPRGIISQKYAVIYTNFHVLIDKEGKIKAAIPGDISEEDIQSLL